MLCRPEAPVPLISPQRSLDRGSRPPVRCGRAVPAVAAALIALLASPSARAHSVGISRGDYTLAGAVLEAELSFAEEELRDLVPRLDGDGDGDVDARELEGARAALDRAIVEPIVVRGSRGRCPGALSSVEPADQDGITIRARFACTTTTASIGLELGFLGALSHGHRHLATATADGALAHAVTHAAATKLELRVDARRAAPAAPADAESSTLALDGLVERPIFELWLFVFAAALVERARRGLVRALATFAVAVGLGLAASTLGTSAASASFVSAAVALALAYVGVDNMLVATSPERWSSMVPFGLVFGFALAGAGSSETAAPVLVGAGAAVAVAVLAALALQRARWFGDPGVRLVSAVVAMAGVWWFVEQVA
jgi:hypothetical protein